MIVAAYLLQLAGARTAAAVFAASVARRVRATAAAARGHTVFTPPPLLDTPRLPVAQGLGNVPDSPRSMLLTNPLHAANAEPGALHLIARAGCWTCVSDGEDTWYAHTDGRLSWLPPEDPVTCDSEEGNAAAGAHEPPPGLATEPEAEAGAAGWTCVTDGKDVWYAHPDGRLAWTVPSGDGARVAESGAARGGEELVWPLTPVRQAARSSQWRSGWLSPARFLGAPTSPAASTPATPELDARATPNLQAQTAAGLNLAAGRLSFYPEQPATSAKNRLGRRQSARIGGSAAWAAAINGHLQK